MGRAPSVKSKLPTEVGCIKEAIALMKESKCKRPLTFRKSRVIQER